jgi:hypothetical protein
MTLKMTEVNDNGQGRGKGRARQEGQAQEGDQELDFIYQELRRGREELFVNDVCVICTRTQEEHANSSVAHVFTPEGVRVDTSQFGPKRSDRGGEGDSTSRHYGASQTPFDPVLRQALIDKGILTPADLQAASEKIALFTQAVVTPTPRPRGMSRG